MPKKKSVRPVKTLKIQWIVLILAIIAFSVLFVIHKSQPKPKESPVPISTKKASFDFGNRTINLNDQSLLFKDDAFSDSSGHTASVESRSVNPSQTEAAAILIDNPGGSGTFYYLVGAQRIKGQEVYSQPVLLGDRIAIDGISVEDPGPNNDGIITVEYSDRAKNAPMSDEPTVSKTAKYAFGESGNLISVLH